MLSRRSVLGAAGLTLSPFRALALGGSQSRARDAKEILTPTAFFTGGAFPGKPTPALAAYLLSLRSVERAKVCWIGAAGGDDEGDYQAFQKTLTAFDVTTEHFNIFRPQTDRFEQYFKSFDYVYVDGGSTRNLMALLREWKIDAALRSAWLSGVIMSGSSAGALCWFEAGLSDSYPVMLSPVRGLGFLPGSCDVHHHSRPDRAARFRQAIADGSLPSPGLALDEEVGALYRGNTLIELVSGDETAGAWTVEKKGASVEERPLVVRRI